MMGLKHYLMGALLLVAAIPVVGQTQNNVLDEVIWVVGDEPILRSDVEFQRMTAEMQGQHISGDPYSIIPEQLAINKLFLHQAALDSITVSESEVADQAQSYLDFQISTAGSKEKLEEYRNMTVKQIKQEIIRSLVEMEKIRQVKAKIVGEKSATPAEVRRYFKNMPKDSLPFIPTQVEVQILTQMPAIGLDEVNRIKDELQGYARRINSGETSFATLARLYSQDESARNGGELDYSGRGELVPEFANVAFSLTDKNTVSKIVKTEYGYHLIQLMDRKGDKIKVRHILLKPEASDEAVANALARLDSISADIRRGKFTFNDAVYSLSDDKETRCNYGLMAFKDMETRSQTSRFQMKDLPQDVAKVVDGMEVGEISKPFTMRDSRGQLICAIVLLKNRIESHPADITADFQALSNIVTAQREEEVLRNWIKEKQKVTYISIKDGWKKNDFLYPDWIK